MEDIFFLTLSFAWQQENGAPPACRPNEHFGGVYLGGGRGEGATLFNTKKEPEGTHRNHHTKTGHNAWTPYSRTEKLKGPIVFFSLFVE